MKKTVSFRTLCISFLLLIMLVVPSSVLSVNSEVEINEFANQVNSYQSDLVIEEVLMDDYNIKSKLLGGQYVDLGVTVRNQGDRDFTEGFSISIFLDHYVFLDEQHVTESITNGKAKRVYFDNTYIDLRMGKHTLSAFINDNVHKNNYCEFITTFLGIGTMLDYFKEFKSITKDNNKGKALFASIYVELDPDSPQVKDILDNLESIPQGFLTNIDITVPDPNDEDGEWFFIAPFIRTLIGDWIGIGPFFDMIAPTETTIVHIKILWGDVHYVDWPPEEDKPDEFIIDGWTLLLSWEY